MYLLALGLLLVCVVMAAVVIVSEWLSIASIHMASLHTWLFIRRLEGPSLEAVQAESQVPQQLASLGLVWACFFIYVGSRQQLSRLPGS